MALPSMSEYSDSTNSRTYALTRHSVSKPALVINKRRDPSSDMAEAQLKVVQGSVDAEGLPTKNVLFDLTIRRPIAASQADVDAALADLRALVADATFTAFVNARTWPQ